LGYSAGETELRQNPDRLLAAVDHVVVLLQVDYVSFVLACSACPVGGSVLPGGRYVEKLVEVKVAVSNSKVLRYKFS
jgi:hypothetical protein